MASIAGLVVFETAGFALWELLGWPLAVAVGGLLAMGFHQRVVVAPKGISQHRTFLGIAWRTRRTSLSAPVGVWSTFENPDGDSVTIGDEAPIVVPAGKMGGTALKEAFEKAVTRATVPLESELK